jgi:hypothetical protein
MIFKKSELEILLLQLDATDGKVNMGLLNEKIPLSLKRRLARIRDSSLVLWGQYVKDKEEAKADPKELEILNNEEVIIDLPKVSLAMIEAIDSSYNYNWDILEKIAE